LEPVTRVIILAALFFWMQLAGEMILRLTAMGLAWILQLGQA